MYSERGSARQLLTFRNFLLDMINMKHCNNKKTFPITRQRAIRTPLQLNGPPVLLVLYVRNTSRPKSSIESWERSRDLDVFVGAFCCSPTSAAVLLALYGDDYDDNDGDDNNGSPILLALYVRSTSRPKSSCESWGRSHSKPRPTSPTPMYLWVYSFFFPQVLQSF